MTVKRMVEKYYTVTEVAGLLSVSKKTVRNWVRAKKFGLGVTKLMGSDLRIPASGVNAVIDANRLFKEGADDLDVNAEDVDPGVFARNPGELKRKLAARE